MKITLLMTSLMAAMATLGCSGSAKADASAAESAADSFTAIESFSADSAYAYVAKQTELGPRVPGSEAHRQCADWITGRLEAFGADTVMQLGAPVAAWDGTVLPMRNIFAQYRPELAERIILLAHYDCRPWADHDPDPTRRTDAIDGANDGASGVGVMLEIARNLGLKRPDIGVDLLFTDLEDYGAREDANVADSESTWCLGTQHFAANLPYEAGHLPQWGILLDMVGGRDAKFRKEYFSLNYAPAPTAKVWNMARKVGLGDRFVNRTGGAVTDDHLPLIRAGIPVTDIIETKPDGGFNPTWHTHQDNIDNIDRNTLGAVGKVVLNLIYN